VRKLINTRDLKGSSKKKERIAWNLSTLLSDKEFDVNEGWLRLISAKKYRGKLVIQNRLLKIAVVFIFALFMGVVLYNIDNDRNFLPEVKMVETIVPHGSKIKMVLPDGTSVWLNAGSKFTYPSYFNGKDRTVLLEGEAYFDVVTMPEKPFRVKTGEAIVKALGTSFNVKAYPEEGVTETTLIKGELVVSKIDKKSEIKLKPNEKITIIGNIKKSDVKEVLKSTLKDAGKLQEETLREIQAKKVILEKQVDTEPVSSWKENNWIITEEPLASLAVKLERRYDVTIDFKNNELKQMKFSGTLRDESVEQVLTYMSRVSNLDYVIDGKQVAFYKKK
jgi:ferric-dicitrate binding protein FerR (iron transport regulator)